jgi:photosystem II stability/assembly factor-like uncharacterized protein
VLVTTDGGTTWRALPDLGGAVRALDFINPSIGWAATDLGVLNTQNGGQTWLTVSTAPAPVNRVEFIDESNGWAATSAELVRTRDGGKTWVPTEQPCGAAAGPGQFSFDGPSSGWMLCYGQPATMMQGKRLFLTQDGGLTWAVIASTLSHDRSRVVPGQLPSTGHVLPRRRQLFFVDGQHGWFVLDRSGRLYATADGGSTWSGRPVVGVDAESLADLQFVSSAAGYVLVRDVLFMTSDGGNAWRRLYPP